MRMLRNRTKILVAEDEPLQGGLLVHHLRQHGFEVLDAASGEIALAILSSRGGFDVLVTDIDMRGGCDGWDLAEKCRVLIPRLFVIYTTSGARDAERQVPRSLFIRKPYDPNAVSAGIIKAGVAGSSRS